ncbi:MAG: hypothetical protein WDA12_00740 [Bacilli bacterium]
MDLYLVFSQTGTWLSTVLKFFIRDKYVHTSFSFSEKLDCMYSFGRINPNNPFSGGFVIEDLRTGVYKRNVNSECIIYKFKITKKQYNTLQKSLANFTKNSKNLKYNFLGLFAVAVNKSMNRKNHHFCSQFVAELFIEAGIFKSNKSPDLFRPNDILQHLNTYEKIYEGYIIDYVTNYDSLVGE